MPSPRLPRDTFRFPLPKEGPRLEPLTGMTDQLKFLSHFNTACRLAKINNRLLNFLLGGLR